MSKNILIPRELASACAHLLVERFNAESHVRRVDLYVDCAIGLVYLEREDLVSSLRYPRRKRPVIYVNGKQL